MRKDTAMKKERSTTRVRRSRRVLGTLAALAATTGVAGAATGTAEAAPSMTVYLHPIQVLPGDVCVARVGVDISMSYADALALLAHPGEEATAKLWGDDWWDNALISLPVDSPTWPQAWEGGYSVEFTRAFGCHVIDEDYCQPWELGWCDEIYAQVSFLDIRNGRTYKANSNVVIGDF